MQYHLVRMFHMHILGNFSDENVAFVNVKKKPLSSPRRLPLTSKIV